MAFSDRRKHCVNKDLTGSGCSADDVPGNRMIIVRLLERLGHKVICVVSNGAELLCECSAQQVDLVVTDLDMPVMDGLAAAQELSEKGIPSS